MSCWGNTMSAGVAVMIMDQAAQGDADETPSHCGSHRAASVSLPAKPAKNYGNLLLAFFGFGNLGIYHVVLGEVSAPSARIRHLLPWCIDSVGHAVSLAARHYHFVS